MFDFIAFLSIFDFGCNCHTQIILCAMKSIRQNITYHNNDKLVTLKNKWSGNRAYKGKFVNNDRRSSHGVGNVLKWRFSVNPQRKEKREENWNPPVNVVHSLNDVKGDSLIWLGHNSFFMQIDGVRIMFDPVFGHIPFVRRKSRLPVNPAIFTNINYLLISHDHYDHLDKKSVKLLFDNNPKISVICGLGVGELIAKWAPPTVSIIEAGWYQQYNSNKVKITFLPCKHWGKRSALDGGVRLWGAFMVESDKLSLYYSGDTGYSGHFSEVKKIFGPPDYALIGIGAYKPRWFMQPNHISPTQALDASVAMGAMRTIPMHYGTFDLSDEPFSDPPKVFAREARQRKIDICLPNLGQIIALKPIANRGFTQKANASQK